MCPAPLRLPYLNSQCHPRPIRPNSSLAVTPFTRYPSIVGSAYTNNMAGVTTTVLYDIDSNLNTVVIQNPPNNGALNTVGGLSVDVTDLVGFDIQKGSGTAYASLIVSGTVSAGLYTINLTSGKANLLGTIGESEAIRDIAVIPVSSIYFPLIVGDTASTP